MQTEPAPSVTFDVRVGTAGGPQLCVHAGNRSIPIDVTLEQAASLGVALISASALFSPGQSPPTSGETVQAVNLPVVGWQAGKNERSGLPAVQLTLLGGASLVLQFTRSSIGACARMLDALAADLEYRVNASDPNGKARDS